MSIKKRKYAKSLSVVVIGLLTVTTISIYVSHRRSHALEIVYREVAVERGDLEVRVASTGTVEPRNRFEIKPPVAGRIDQVLVKEGQTVKKGEVIARMSSSERAALLDAARTEGPNVMKQWEKNYRQIPIVAPANGSIIRRNVEPGQSFTTNDTVLVMSDVLTVKAQVDETDIAEIRLRSPATIVLDAYPNLSIAGEVGDIAYEAKTVNNVITYLVNVLPEKVPNEMRSGMTANITFSVTSKKQVLNIPNDSLHVEENKYSVLVKTPDHPVEKTIVVGVTDGKRTEISSGLSEGDTVLAAEIVPSVKK